MSRPTCICRPSPADTANGLRRAVPGGQRAPSHWRPIRAILGRIATAGLLSLLAPPTIAAFPADSAETQNSAWTQTTSLPQNIATTKYNIAAQNYVAVPPTVMPNNDSVAETIYPSTAFASQANIAPPADVLASIAPSSIDRLDSFPQPGGVPSETPVQLISFQQPSNPTAEPVPSGMMLHQMVQQDTGAPDLNALANQSAYCPPPTATAPDVTGDYHCDCDAWHWQVLPQGIIYQSYMAGTKEPRLSTFFNQSTNGAVANATPEEDYTGIEHDMWDVTLGARVGIWRYGNSDPNWPEGWQLDIEGAVFPRLAPYGFSTPLIGDDYRFGIPLTYGGDRWEFKMGYYHISAHLGDEYLLYVNPDADRINYVRDSAVLGAGYFFTPSFRTYGEVGVAAVDGGAKPVELQFGCEWMQARNTGFRGGPFAAINGDLRQEVDYGGNVTVQFGWMWRQYARGSNFRIGGQYFYGKDDEYEFFNQTVSRIGWGMWYDF